MSWYARIIRSVPGYGAGVNDGRFTPNLAIADPDIPYEPLVNAGDPAPTATVQITWVEIQAGAAVPTSTPPHLLLNPGRAARFATLLRF